MATGNFFSYKANYIYLPKSFREGFGETEGDSELLFYSSIEEVRNFLEVLEKELDNKKFYNCKITFYNEMDGKDWIDNYARRIGTINIYRELPYDEEKYEDEDIQFNVEILMVSGYYEGYSIDYDYDENELDRIDEIAEEDKIYREFSNAVYKVLGILETILQGQFDKYVISARFSSGETWYKRVE